MADLVIPLKAEYFNAIRDGQKVEEFRERTPYWRRRLEGRTFDRVVLTLGYPPAGDTSRRLVREWRGYRETTITHPHFGDKPVDVFAIDVATVKTAPAIAPARVVPIYKQPLCECASKGTRCQGRKPGLACQAHDKWYVLPCSDGKCPGYMHPDCCGRSGDSEATEE